MRYRVGRWAPMEFIRWNYLKLNSERSSGIFEATNGCCSTCDYLSLPGSIVLPHFTPEISEPAPLQVLISSIPRSQSAKRIIIHTRNRQAEETKEERRRAFDMEDVLCFVKAPKILAIQKLEQRPKDDEDLAKDQEIKAL